MKTTPTLLALMMLSLSPIAFAADYTCTPEIGDVTKLSIDASGKIEFSDKSAQDVPANFDCPTPSKERGDAAIARYLEGKTLYSNGLGPNSWYYVVPNDVTSADREIHIDLILDEDSDGMACEIHTLTCTQN